MNIKRKTGTVLYEVGRLIMDLLLGVCIAVAMVVFVSWPFIGLFITMAGLLHGDIWLLVIGVAIMVSFRVATI